MVTGLSLVLIENQCINNNQQTRKQHEIHGGPSIAIGRKRFRRSCLDSAGDIANDGKTELPPLTSIWEDGWLKFLGIGKKKKMTCLDCGKTFADNANKAAFHSARVKGGDINVCEAEIPPNWLRRYKFYHDGVIVMKVSRERAKAVNEFLL